MKKLILILAVIAISCKKENITIYGEWHKVGEIKNNEFIGVQSDDVIYFYTDGKFTRNDGENGNYSIKENYIFLNRNMHNLRINERMIYIDNDAYLGGF